VLIVNHDNVNWCLRGDFNVIRSEEERKCRGQPRDRMTLIISEGLLIKVY